MPVIDFTDAREMVIAFEGWMVAVSEYIAQPDNPPPVDFYNTQKLSFEIDKNDLADIMKKDRVVGVLCLEPGASTLSVVMVGVNSEGKPEAAIKPCETWPKLNKMDELEEVLTRYLTPKD